jgi:hypothetical protein
MTATKVFPPFDKHTDLPPDHDDSTGTKEFLAAHPEFYRSDYNASLLAAFLELHGGLPFTKWNLEIAFCDLKEDGLLEKAPAPAPEAAIGNPSITLTVTDRLAEYQAPASELVELAKLRDDPNLTDHQRKARDRKLTLLAGKQRRELAPQNLYR